MIRARLECGLAELVGIVLHLIEFDRAAPSWVGFDNKGVSLIACG